MPVVMTVSYTYYNQLRGSSRAPHRRPPPLINIGLLRLKFNYMIHIGSLGLN